jgi:hypothetical protein
MSNKQLLVLVAYLLIFGGFGFTVGYSIKEDQQIINNQLKEEYNELKENYDNLETEYKWKLESCYQQLGDMQDDYDVNNDGLVNSLDLLGLQKYILNQGGNELGD